MDANRIREMRLAEPFRPFRLRLADGRQFDVLKPLHLAMSQNNARVLVVTGGDAAVWFSPAAVNDIELLNDAERPAGARQ
jgi:hypothetical protein